MRTLVERRYTSHSTAAQALLGAVVGVVRLLILWKEIRSARRMLQAMPDGLLSDMGVSRGSIDHATAFGRQVRKPPNAFTSR